MKVSKYFKISVLIISFNCVIAMEEGINSPKDEKVVPKIPVGVFQELAKAGINEAGKTEKDVFAVADKFMKAGGGSAKAIMNLVKETAAKKYTDNYTYGDFKNDIMDDIIDTRARKEAWEKYKSSNDSFYKQYTGTDWDEYFKLNPETKLDMAKSRGYPENKLDIAAKMEATNWAKHQLKYDRKFKENLQKRFTKVFNEKNIDLGLFEAFLKLGADPNTYTYHGPNPLDLDFITSWRILNNGTEYYYPDSLKILELLLKYGANPNIKSNWIQKSNSYLGTGDGYPNYPLHRVLDFNYMVYSEQRSDILLEERLNIIKLLLKYGTNANLKDPLGRTPLYYAKDELNRGYTKENDKKIVKQIIKVLEEVMTKPPQKDKSGKEEI